MKRISRSTGSIPDQSERVTMNLQLNGQTNVYGLIGSPVDHSISPLIHNTLAQRMGMNLAYVPLPVEDPGRLEDAIKGAYALGICGMNVTVPYKQAVIPYLKELDPVAEKIGAVNTLRRIEGGYKGYNTDYLGLSRALDLHGIRPSEYPVLIIGAGGVARAAGFMAGTEGVRKLCIINRTVSRAHALADDLAAVFPDMHVTAAGISDTDSVPDHVLAIQCTKVGLYPVSDQTPVQDPHLYDKIAAAYDCIYRPKETCFMKDVRAMNHPAFGGLDMLLWQGISAFEIWTGSRVSREDAAAAANAMESYLDRN